MTTLEMLKIYCNVSKNGKSTTEVTKIRAYIKQMSLTTYGEELYYLI